MGIDIHFIYAGHLVRILFVTLTGISCQQPFDKRKGFEQIILNSGQTTCHTQAAP